MSQQPPILLFEPALEPLHSGAERRISIVQRGEKEMQMIRHGDGRVNVPMVRWMAPVTGMFSVSAFWDDSDLHGGGGASGNVIVKGVSVPGVSFANNGNTSTGLINPNLIAGDFVDFVLGRNANVAHDITAFNATIIGTPEPARAVVTDRFRGGHDAEGRA